MEYVQITDCNSFILDAFIFTLKIESNKHFRYYNTRKNNEYQRHIYTLVITENMIPVAYGHIELENKYWIGICVLKEFRGKGYGSMIMKHLITIAENRRIPRLSLTVDKDNHTAISLYRKHNFIDLYEHEHHFEMILNLLSSSQIVTLPVSYGEAFDKLAILKIKLNKVSEEKKADVRREYDAVLSSIAHLFNENITFYYKHLIDCSIIIWNKQVEFRSATQNRTTLCEEIIFENDRRGKLKNKINKILSSHLVEQKDGYILKKAYVPDGEDIFMLVGMIRYLATIYDEVLVYCTNKEFKTIFFDDDTIKFTSKRQYLEDYVYPIINEDSEIPLCYYNDIPIESKYYFTYYYVPTTEKSKELYNRVRNRKYIVTNINLDNIEISDLLLNVNETHIEFQDYYMNHNTLDYKDLLINADAIYLSNSSILHLAFNLDLKSDKCYYISEEEYLFIKNVNRKKFIRLNV